MKEWLEQVEQYGIGVILGHNRSRRANLLRVALLLFSVLYAALVRLRLLFFRQRVIRDRDLGCMVVCIGNLTVGGTGKTPVVEMFARALRERGRRVAVLSRGYKSERTPRKRRSPARLIRDALAGRQPPKPEPRIVSDGTDILLDSRFAGDEPWMLARNLPGVPVIVDKDRVNGGRHAIQRLGADTLLLDDGLQYLRLRHRLDIVLIDRTAPFGNGFLLPRGTLREPPRSLRRASYILITKCDGASNDELITRIRRHNRTAEIIECRHSPRYLEHLVTGDRLPVTELEGKYVGAISGIAVPQSFEGGLSRLGAHVEVKLRFADHHRFDAPEVTAFMRRCLDRDLAMVVTTEKDAVRFPTLERYDLPLYFLRIEIEVINGHEHFEACIDRICNPAPAPIRRLPSAAFSPS